MMLKPIMKSALVGLAALTVAACMTTNQVTGRSQFIIIPPSQDAALGLEAMKEVKKSASVQTSGLLAARVQRIGNRIAAISDKPDLDWEFVVIDEPVLNAWALPGGKIAIYRKMVDSFTSDEELAAVIGHEIAHAVLRHGAEQMSRAQMQNLLIVGAGVAVGASTEDQETAQMAVGLASLATAGFVQLPHSRKMELEADHIGAIYMAKAGYDPRASVRLWQRMKTLKEGGGQQPTFLSTHPSDDKRIARLEERMPEYLSHYQK
ncbi:M48 family metallopeptidase [Kordiimonas lacus]|uniref:Peptidase family M48 n=1 Tax=Kordiimonas lacus TaxID=637679 RepID=A0A1G7DK39_9PROT|nr:M48 family metallopeptidase [Kordiimonas lacus]SDE51456.1 Peptidase family M48 [Kordiimonas lacus]